MAVTAIPDALSAPPSAAPAPPPVAPARPAAPAPPAAASRLAPALAGPSVPVSATLAANEAIARRRRAGEPVLPLGFGEAGLPVHPALLAALGAVTGGNDYGPVAGRAPLREAAAGYWTRRGLPTDPA